MKKLNVIIGVLFYVIIVSMFSCGARKLNKEHTKEENKTEVVDNSVIEKQSENNVKTSTTIKTDDKNETVTEETTISPEDPTKEAFIIEKDGTKVVLNNTKRVYKKTTQKNNTQSQIFGKSEEVQKQASKEQKKVKQINTSKKENSVKNVKKESFNLFNLLWLLIPITIIYICYRIYKKLPLLPKI